jgi:hypothetical protein
MNPLTVIPIEIVIGLVFGYFIAKKAAAEKPIKGGPLAQLFHYTAASTFIATGPTVLINAIVLKVHLVPNILIALCILAAAMLQLIIFAAFESRAVKTA